MYPHGHPALTPALDAVCRRAELLLIDRPMVAVGVARDRLVVQGIATDIRQPVLRALADLLHRHQLSAITFSRGLDVSELAGVVRAIAEPPDRGTGPLGNATPERLSQWPHVGFHSLKLGGLEIIGEGEGEARSATPYAELWVGLATAAIERAAGGGDDDLALEPAVVARAIDEHQRVEAYDQVVVGYLLQIAEELRGAQGEEAEELRRRTSLLVSAMQPETLQRLLAMGGDALQRQRFVADAALGMAAGAVVDLVQAAAEASSETVSHGLVRLFSKLAAHAEQGAETTRPLADSALRDQVQRLLADWNLADPNPDDYRSMLQRMAQSAPTAGRRPDDADGMSEPLRIVQMSLELEEDGPAYSRALYDIVAGDELPTLIQLLSSLPESALAKRTWARLSSPNIVREVLDRAVFDTASLDAILPHLSAGALVPMLELLIESPDRHVRRMIFDRLRSVGPPVVAIAIQHLDDERWYVIRNLLSLLALLDDAPAGVDPRPWLRHADPRVRREAFRLAFRLDPYRNQALALALKDDDSRVLAQALAALADDPPAEARGPLMDLVEDEMLDDGMRGAAIKALVKVGRDPEVLDVLLHITGGDTMWTPWRTLPPTSQALLSSLTALSQLWREDRRAASVVRRARVSSDADVRQAVTHS